MFLRIYAGNSIRLRSDPLLLDVATSPVASPGFTGSGPDLFVATTYCSGNAPSMIVTHVTELRILYILDESWATSSNIALGEDMNTDKKENLSESQWECCTRRLHITSC